MSNPVVEPLSETVVEPGKCGTLTWDLGEPGARFRACCTNHPETLLARPQV